MAEGLLRHLSGGVIDVFSAGDEPAHVQPLAIQTMAALGIDISRQRAKHLDEFRGQAFDLIVTVCDRVREQCPIFPNDPAQIHWSIPDPLAATPDQAAAVFQTTARTLRTRINYLLLTMTSTGPFVSTVPA
jgi:protein-tyrosine-phosphatase